MEPVLIEGFAEVVALDCSSECVDGRADYKHGDCLGGLGGLPTRNNCESDRAAQCLLEKPYSLSVLLSFWPSR
jgi:hypothetical protein